MENKPKFKVGDKVFFKGIIIPGEISTFDSIIIKITEVDSSFFYLIETPQELKEYGTIHALEKELHLIYEQKENKPHHYSQGIDAWEIIDRSFTPEQQNGFDAGNVIKYVIRHEHKNGLEDLKKARHYLNRMIKRMEEA